jgi:aryl-alcohol dehydrogenase-like predicted oxidoreductase
MRTVFLGQLEVSEVGLGCLSMHQFYGPPPKERVSIATIHRAGALGINLLDTSDLYGGGANEELVGRAIADRRSKWIVATKFGIIQKADGSYDVRARPDDVRQACEASLRRLKVDAIDLYYLHRVDKSVAIEDTVGAMARLVEAGKVRFIGLSEAAPATLRRAHAIYPITALQTEYSLWTRDVEDKILGVCNSLNIGFVAYAALGRGFFAGSVTSPDRLESGDKRREMPRFQTNNFGKNLQLFHSFRRLAEALGHTPAQVALAWLRLRNTPQRSRKSAIVPLIGTSRPERIQENSAAVDIDLPEDVLDTLDRIFQANAVAGLRYSSTQFRRIDFAGAPVRADAAN